MENEDTFSVTETERRRDEVVRRMLATPPKPHVKAPLRKEKESTGEGRKPSRASSAKAL
jgi:hypothetical protein